MRRPYQDLSLRLCGLLLIAIATLTIAHLVKIAPGNAAQARPAVYLLCLLAFLGGSSGSALLLQGRHLFDNVSVSDRWITRDRRR
jgi:hypothetical protein